MTEGFLVVRLYERPDGRYVPAASVQLPGKVEAITDPKGRTYRDLNLAVEIDFWLLTRWRAKHARKLRVVVTQNVTTASPAHSIALNCLTSRACNRGRRRGPLRRNSFGRRTGRQQRHRENQHAKHFCHKDLTSSTMVSAAAFKGQGVSLAV
jgi:hypothetical protein